MTDGVSSSGGFAAIRLYLKWQVIAAYAPALPARFSTEAARYKDPLAGPQSPWVKVLSVVTECMGDALSRLYVERYTSRAYFQSVLAMPGIFG